MNIDRERLARLIVTLRAAQSHIGAKRPDDDLDEAKYWDSFDDGIEVVQEIMGHEGPFLVRVRWPYWADRNNTAEGAMFFFGGLTGGEDGHLGTQVQTVYPSDAFEFKTLAAAELIAAQLGGVVMTFKQLVAQLREESKAGNEWSTNTLNELLPRNGESLIGEAL